MAEYHIKGILKHRRDTSSNWTSKNPIILDGEIILVDTSAGDIRIKVGDGTKHYSELPFLDEKINVGTAYRALITDASGRLSTSSVTSTELGYISGVTSAVQTQLNNKVPSSRTINRKALTSDITLSAADVGAQPKITVEGIVQGDGSGNLSAVEVTEAETIELDAAAVGLGNVDNVKQYSAGNPPPYPVTSVNGQTDAVKTSYYVTITPGENGAATADRTPQEVYAAYTAGYAVYALANFGDGFIPFVLPLAAASNFMGGILLGFGALGSTGQDASPQYPTVVYNGSAWQAWVGTLARASDVPTALKNPNMLNIKVGGVTTSYDGSSTKTVEIPDQTYSLTDVDKQEIAENVIDGGVEVQTGNGSLLPVVTVADNGKIPRVVNGVWTAVELSSAGGASF